MFLLQGQQSPAQGAPVTHCRSQAFSDELDGEPGPLGQDQVAWAAELLRVGGQPYQASVQR